ncbi:MAG: alanine racemase [Proteobacteria bacterium]|nr:alanine racemase [Pseudomonadota bacterium]
MDKINTYIETIEKAQLYIDLKALKYNYKLINQLTKESVIIGIVKGDAYGHGMLQCSKTLIKSGCKHLYVANIEDALKLRSYYRKVRIFVLSGPINPHEVETLDSNKITPIINNPAQLELVLKYSLLKNKKMNAIIQIDTGMNRMGFKHNEFSYLNEKLKMLNVSFLMSHFTSADEKDKKNSNKQLKQLVNLNQNLNYKLSIANSSGCFLNSSYHLDYVRPGKSLYGMNPFKKKSFKLKQVASLYAPIIQTSSINKNETVGYGKTYTAQKKIKTATINFGYANGYMRSGSSRAVTYINSIPAKVLGRISMDLITIDVSNIPDQFLYLGYPVEILGKNATYEKVSESLGTHELETLISIGLGTQKKYLS